MKKIKILLLAAIAVLGFAACSSNDDDTKENVISEYSLNDQMVAKQKAASKKNKAILLIAFGSTWSNAFSAFDNTKAAYEAAFPDADVYVSFSSDICINRASAGENGEARDYYEPRYLLHAIGAAKYSTVIVQSLQVIPGEEFANVVAQVKKFMNNGYIKEARLDDAYLKKLSEDEAIFLGMPLLADPDNDVPAVAQALHKHCGDEVNKGVVAFMGHGNPDNYDTFKANIRYTQLQDALQAINPNYYVGTVDAPDTYKYDVKDAMSAAGVTSGNVYLHCLMSIAGDHAHNDMAGQGEEYMPESNDEWEDNEDVSWFEYFKHENYTPIVPLGKNNEPLGLLEISDVLKVWINHTKNAEFLEDAYHSMYPEE